MISFEMVGKLSLPKETDSFKNYEEKEYASSWINKTLKFNVISGDNRFMLQSKAGYFKDMHNDIFVFSKDSVTDSGQRVKGEAFRIPFKERLTHPRLEEVANYRKFVIDLEVPNFRRELMNAVEKVKDGGELTEEEVSKFGASDVKGLEAALEKSKNKRKEFISEYDFIDMLRKVLASDKYKNKKFRVSGTYDMQYSDANNRFYSNYVPNRIYLADDNAEETATASTVLFFDHTSLVSAKEEKNKYYVNGWVQVYDNNRKENIFAPYGIVIPGAKDDSELEVKREKAQVKRFTVYEEDAVYEYGVTLNLLNGAQRTEITEDMLTEEQKDSLLFGEITMDDIRREMGSVYGDKVVENVFVKPARGYTRGREETSYCPSDMVVKSLNNENAFVEAESESDSDDLFDDDDLDLFS